MHCALCGLSLQPRTHKQYVAESLGRAWLTLRSISYKASEPETVTDLQLELALNSVVDMLQNLPACNLKPLFHCCSQKGLSEVSSVTAIWLAQALRYLCCKTPSTGRRVYAAKPSRAMALDIPSSCTPICLKRAASFCPSSMLRHQLSPQLGLGKPHCQIGNPQCPRCRV